jgi:hypothetical protein
MTAWKLPLVVSAIALPIVAGFYVGGPGLGMAVGALAAASIVFLAVRHPPLGEIVIAPAPDERSRVLVVLDAALGVAGAAAIATIVEDALLAAGALPQVLLLAPCRSSFAERWTSDLEPGRERARADLAQSLSTLDGLGITASTQIGDEDTVQMTEDVLRSFPATEIVLVEDEDTGAAETLQSRLAIPLHRTQTAAQPETDRIPIAVGRRRASYGRVVGAAS